MKHNSLEPDQARLDGDELSTGNKTTTSVKTIANTEGEMTVQEWLSRNDWARKSKVSAERSSAVDAGLELLKGWLSKIADEVGARMTLNPVPGSRGVRIDVGAAGVVVITGDADGGTASILIGETSKITWNGQNWMCGERRVEEGPMFEDLLTEALGDPEA